MEVDTFADIISYRKSGDSEPSTWEVRTSAGVTRYYGTTSDSRIRLLFFFFFFLSFSFILLLLLLLFLLPSSYSFFSFSFSSFIFLHFYRVGSSSGMTRVWSLAKSEDLSQNYVLFQYNNGFIFLFIYFFFRFDFLIDFFLYFYHLDVQNGEYTITSITYTLNDNNAIASSKNDLYSSEISFRFVFRFLNTGESEYI